MGKRPWDAVDWSNREVLVGVLHNARQLEANLRHRFYHIPASLLEEAESVRYVALYQSIRHFGRDGAGIRHYGRVEAPRLLHRREITEIPKREGGDELYYRFDVAEWNRLERPIRAGGAAPGVFLRTNLYLLEHGRAVPELYIRTPQQLEAYLLLRRAVARTRRGGGAERLPAPPGYTVLVAGASIGIYTPQGEYVHLDFRDFSNEPYDFLQKVVEFVQIGG